MFNCAHVRFCNAIRVCIGLVGVLAIFPGVLVAQAPGTCLSDNEATLGDLINEYRMQNGLEPVPFSRSLTEVAQWHVWDLDVNDPVGGQCNLHSWSDASALWTPVCYTDDHANASGMWFKPREITGNVYTGYGFEISYWGGNDPASALNLWKQSPGHNDVILNAGTWDNYNPWPGMGIGMRNGFAVVWFGNVSDPQGTIDPCSASPTHPTTWGAVKALYTENRP